MGGDGARAQHGRAGLGEGGEHAGGGAEPEDERARVRVLTGYKATTSNLKRYEYR